MNRDSRWPHAQDPSRRLTDKVVEGLPWGVVEEDRWALDTEHKMMVPPDDGYEEVHIKTDGAVIACLERLERLKSILTQPRSPACGPGRCSRQTRWSRCRRARTIDQARPAGPARPGRA